MNRGEDVMGHVWRHCKSESQAKGM
jgi:hypothetical protein